MATTKQKEKYEKFIKTFDEDGQLDKAVTYEYGYYNSMLLVAELDELFNDGYIGKDFKNKDWNDLKIDYASFFYTYNVFILYYLHFENYEMCTKVRGILNAGKIYFKRVMLDLNDNYAELKATLNFIEHIAHQKIWDVYGKGVKIYDEETI